MLNSKDTGDKMTSNTFTTKVTGHVLIKDKNTDEVLLDKFNAVHNKNMAIVIARALSNESPDPVSGLSKHQIYKLKLGNGGSSINSTNMITYLPPRVTLPTANLYAPTYSEVIDDSVAGHPSENSVTYMESPAPDLTTVVICTATVAAGEPSGQDLTDSPPNADADANATYAFDELGLFTSDDLLLTHIIFSPILKTANRELVITYSLTISVS